MKLHFHMAFQIQSGVQMNIKQFVGTVNKERAESIVTKTVKNEILIQIYIYQKNWIFILISNT